MMYRISSETYAHQCEDADKYIAEHRKRMALVIMHDGIGGLTFPDSNKSIYVKYCPLCGCKIDEDAVTDQWLPSKYNPWKEA